MVSAWFYLAALLLMMHTPAARRISDVQSAPSLAPGLERLLDDVEADPYGRVSETDASEDVEPVGLEPSANTCGLRGRAPCLTVPYCRESRLVVDENVVCVPCGNAVSAPPCMEYPPCDEGLVESSATDECVPCGGENQPVCATARARCDEGLTRSTVRVDAFVVPVQGNGAICER